MDQGRPVVRRAHLPASRVVAALLAGVALLAVAVHLAAAAPRAPRAGAATAIAFSPTGSAKQVRQAQARFPAPMVPLGDPHRLQPFDVACAGTTPAAGHWTDASTWVLDFSGELPGGVRCTFTLRADVRTLAGAPVPGPTTFTFSTGGPTVANEMPATGDTIAEDQAFVLALDGPVDVASVAPHAAFEIDGVPERVPTRLVEGADRDAILAVMPEWFPREQLVVLAATRRFPNGAGVRLRWGPGVAAPTGVAGETPQVLAWTVRTAFTAALRCARESAKSDCIPLTPIRLGFTNDVPWDAVRDAALVLPDGTRRAPQTPPAGTTTVRDLTFAPPFPTSARLRLELPQGVRDVDARPLADAARFPLPVATSPLPPLAKFPSRFGILELHADPALPVTLRGIEPEATGRALHVRGRAARLGPDDVGALLDWLRRVGIAPRTRSVFAGVKPPPSTSPLTLPPLPDASGSEVVGLPLREPGLWVVELASRRLGRSLLQKDAPLYVPTAALVTNVAVHLLWGRESSLAWVTTLDHAEPVAGAHVGVHDCSGRLLAEGTTDAAGIVRFPDLPLEDDLPHCEAEAPEDFTDWEQVRALEGLRGGLFVVARHDDDFGFVHSSWDDGIEPYRFDLPSAPWTGPTTAHTVLDRALFRPGETVHMAHVLRRLTQDGFASPPAADRPTTLVIRHLGSDEQWELPLAWDEPGVATSTWDVPRAAKLGTYELSMVIPPPPGEPEWRKRTLESGSFRVEALRVPLALGTVQLPQTPLVRARDVPVDVGVRYLAGGAARDLPVTLRAETRPFTRANPKAFEAWSIANGPVSEGVVRGGGEDADAEDGTPDAAAVVPLGEQQLTLDAGGTAHATVALPEPAPTPRTLLAELAYRDPNGETQTVAATTTLWPASLQPAVRAEDWALSLRDLHVRAAALDLSGAPVAGARVRVDVFDRVVSSTRVRVVGGFYAWQHASETRHIATLCSGVTGADGTFDCTGTPAVAGNLVVQATVVDADGREASAHTDVWVSRPGTAWWFEARDADRIDLIPERRHYEPGETARFQVRMPFREATALVAIEREGVGSARVVTLSGDAPVIELPVEGSWSPNVFVSVLAVRGRVDDVQPTAMVDLGRPAMKLGIAEIEVGWRAHALDVAVQPEHEVYKIRERATVDVRVRLPDGAPPAPGATATIAAVDEGLLALAPNDSWKVLDAMMGRRGYQVQTASAQLQVVGKRHYGRKALPAGGGGGRQATRELFDTLLLWQARVPLDADGHARVEVPLNDSLTSFRIVAVATSGADRFGTGAATIRATQDLMVLSGLPPVVRVGDRFRAEVTLRNTTSRAMTVETTAAVDGLAAPLAPQQVQLAPESATVVGWDVDVPAVAALAWTLAVGEAGGARDEMRVRQQVLPAVPPQVVAATFAQAGTAPVDVPVARPEAALPDAGGIDVRVAPSLAAGAGAGVRDWLRRYPYGCLEQRVSRAVGLGDDALWRELVDALPTYQDKDGLYAFFPDGEGSDALTSYVLVLADDAGRTLPARTRDRALDALAGFVDGRLRREGLQADLPLRRIAALDALARAGRVDRAMLATVPPSPERWPTSTLLSWWSALRHVPGADAMRGEVARLVRARLVRSGDTLAPGADDDAGPGLFAVPDATATRLVRLALDDDAWRADAPDLLRGALARQRGGAWRTTTANALGALALGRFASAFEAEAVGGTSTVTVGNVAHSVDWSADASGATLAFPWPSDPSQARFAHAGSGRPWFLLQARAAVPLVAPVAHGFRVQRSVDPPPPADGYARGTVVRVRLDVDVDADSGMVVVDDPIPAGSTWATSREPGRPTGDDTGPVPAWIERGEASYRAYFADTPPGHLTLTYALRLDRSGRFNLPPTRVEALYAPDRSGEVPNAPVVVR